jgi:hypothetical protein
VKTLSVCENTRSVGCHAKQKCALTCEFDEHTGIATKANARTTSAGPSVALRLHACLYDDLQVRPCARLGFSDIVTEVDDVAMVRLLGFARSAPRRQGRGRYAHWFRGSSSAIKARISQANGVVALFSKSSNKKP